jgi:ribosomal protein S10
MNIGTQINISSLNKNINKYLYFLQTLLTQLKIPFKSVFLPTKIKKITLLKSPHVNKSAREQFQINIYKRVLQINVDLVPDVFRFIFINKPKFIKLKIRKII